MSSRPARLMVRGTGLMRTGLSLPRQQHGLYLQRPSAGEPHDQSSTIRGDRWSTGRSPTASMCDSVIALEACCTNTSAGHERDRVNTPIWTPLVKQRAIARLLSRAEPISLVPAPTTALVTSIADAKSDCRRIFGLSGEPVSSVPSWNYAREVPIATTT